MIMHAYAWCTLFCMTRQVHVMSTGDWHRLSGGGSWSRGWHCHSGLTRETCWSLFVLRGRSIANWQQECSFTSATLYAFPIYNTDFKHFSLGGKKHTSSKVYTYCPILGGPMVTHQQWPMVLSMVLTLASLNQPLFNSQVTQPVTGISLNSHRPVEIYCVWSIRQFGFCVSMKAIYVVLSFIIAFNYAGSNPMLHIHKVLCE